MTHATPHLLRNVQLDDKFAPGPTRVYLTGIDALVRLPLLQHEIDTAAGLKDRWLYLGIPWKSTGRLGSGAMGRKKALR